MKNFLAIATLALCANAASAQDAGDISAGIGFSSLGGNVEAAYRIDPSFGVRGVFIGGIDESYEETDEDETFEGSIELGGLAVLADYYPNQGDWRISGGLMFSQNEISATGSVDVGLTTEDATISVKFENEIAPMISTGYEWGFADGWTLTPEAGLILTGGLALDYTASDPSAQDEIDNDPDVQEAKSDAEDIVVLPYLAFTVSYQF
ncbi:autotransporter domain-containing protein [Yoonia sp. R2-816]|uniref:autotransporter domain-containing protein n=1 Tax=Yoonia sp. R2-816 TaxID=3342638 RepID=UPI00372A69B1